MPMWTLVALSTLAGLPFGYAYQKTNRIETTILHFVVDAIHFFFFTSLRSG